MDHLVGAYNIAAEAMGMTTEELGKNLKAGKIMAKDMVPKLAKALRELAAPGLAKSLKTLESTENRLLNTWRSFKDLIFTSGLGDFLGGLYTTFGNLLILMKPLANILGGITKGIQDVLYPIEYAIALFLDWAEAMGYLDSTTQNWSQSAQDAFKQVGEVIGWVFGVYAISKIGGMVSGLLGMIGVIGKVRTAFMGMLGAEAAVSAAGTAAIGTSAATAAAGVGLGAIALPSIITGALAYPLELLKQTKVDRTQNPEMIALDLAAKKQAEYQKGTYGATGYGAGSAIPQTVPITLDIKVTGDAMAQYFTKELGNNTTAQ